MTIDNAIGIIENCTKCKKDTCEGYFKWVCNDEIFNEATKMAVDALKVCKALRERIINYEEKDK